MGTDKYAVGAFYLDGMLLTEEISVDLDYDPANSIVVTQQKGFAGITPGAGKITVKVNSAVPRAGFESGAIDFYAIATGRIPVDMMIDRGGQKLTSKGFLMGISEKYAANSDSAVDFTFVGEEPKKV